MTASASAVPARGRRYPVRAQVEARRLARAGFNDAEIARMLADDGHPVSPSLVGRWVRESTADADRKRARVNLARHAEERGGKPLGRPNARPEFKLGRIRALREEVGLKDGQIARLMAFDYGDPITDAMVRHALVTGRYPRSLR